MNPHLMNTLLNIRNVALILPLAALLAAGCSKEKEALEEIAPEVRFSMDFPALPITVDSTAVAGPFGVSVALDPAILAQALQALHGHGVVHGDLSPGNILFTVQGRPAVADLGSSRLLGGTAALGEGLEDLPGSTVVEPVFGLPGKWIPAELRHSAEMAGATVVDRVSVLITHLSSVAAAHADRLLGREDIRVLLRENRIRYQNVARSSNGIVVTLRSEEDRSRAQSLIASDLQDELTLRMGAGSGDSWVINGQIGEAKLREIALSAIEKNVETLRNRVNELGVAEPIIQRQGESRIVVQLPGVQDTAAAKRVIGAQATLEYRAVDDSIDPFEAQQTGRVPPESRLYHMRDGRPVVLSKRLIVSGDQLVTAASGFDSRDGSAMVNVTLNNPGARRMQDFTNNNVGKGMGIVFVERIPDVRIGPDGEEIRTSRIREEVISVANIREPFGKRFQTSGLESSQEASQLALLLRAGSLAAPMDIVEERVIGPSLGQDNIDAGVKAIIVGFVAIILFMAVYYRLFGVIAVLALMANVVMIIGLLSIIGVTLTMPGIAGIVLTIGMAIDANVLICERIREELRGGSNAVNAIVAGYDKAWATILDANLTSLICGVGLLAFGSGPIRGFAIVLCVGILTSMFTAVTQSYAVTSLIYGGKKARKLQTLPI